MIGDVFGHVTDVYFKDQKLISDDVIKNQIWWQDSTSLVWEVFQLNSKWVNYICTEGTIWCHFGKKIGTLGQSFIEIPQSILELKKRRKSSRLGTGRWGVSIPQPWRSVTFRKVAD